MNKEALENLIVKIMSTVITYATDIRQQEIEKRKNDILNILLKDYLIKENINDFRELKVYKRKLYLAKELMQNIVEMQKDKDITKEEYKRLLILVKNTAHVDDLELEQIEKDVQQKIKKEALERVELETNTKKKTFSEAIRDMTKDDYKLIEKLENDHIGD